MTEAKPLFNLITMGKLHDFATRHHKFTESIEGRLVNIVDGNPELADLNRKQISEGKKSTGESMPPYSKTSVEVFHKPAGPIRLYDTGAFQESFMVEAEGSQFKITANDPHDLEGRYGSDIFGISKTRIPTAKRITTKELIKQYLSECYGK